MKTKTFNSVSDIRKALRSDIATYVDTDAGVKADWIASQLTAVDYINLHRDDKGAVREFLQAMTGYSRSQIARNIRAYREEQASVKQAAAVPFAKYIAFVTAVVLLAILFSRHSFGGLNASVSDSSEPLVFFGEENTEELVLNDANDDVFTVRRQLTNKSLIQTRTYISLAKTGDGIIDAKPLFIAQDTVERTGEQSAVRSTEYAFSVEDLLTRVNERRQVRLQNLVNAPVEQPVVPTQPSFAAPDGNGGSDQSVTPAPYVPTGNFVNREIQRLMLLMGSGEPGQVLIFEAGRPQWRSLQEEIRPGAGRKPIEIRGGGGEGEHGAAPSRERGGGGGGRSFGGGGNSSATEPQVVTQIINGGSDSWEKSGGLVFLKTSTDFVGIGTSTPETELEVVGTISGKSLVVSNLVSCSNLVTDANGNISCGPGGGGSGNSVFVGTTSVTTYDGSFSSGLKVGYDAANAICAAEFSGSHFCRTDEILSTIVTEDISTLFSGTPDAWMAEGPPGYTADSNDCRGWTSNTATHLGAWWDFSVSGGGIGYLTNCSTTKPLACCR